MMDNPTPHEVLHHAAGTGRALMRRLHDARWTTRWFVGKGIDVGPGADSLANYQAFFPRIVSVQSWDKGDGDGQHLVGIRPRSFDFLYSSHCLEHLQDPGIAMLRWLEVVKRGGHVIVVVPDEDLYEQGVWPSTYNPDHKHTFTTSSQSSWSPASRFVPLMLVNLARMSSYPFRVVRLERLDHAYFTELGTRLDQTRAVYGESGLEIILQRE